ncbi:hypothetical protein EDC04DRAFT_2607485 [Pisolithus marmoratus]|nr:hypothetical protein EDC04DRAFT_2607485 [Pisolithus marmoratus]
MADQFGLVCKAAKAMQQEHIRAITALIDGVMTTGLGVIKGDKVTPEFKEALDVFLPALKEQSQRQVMRYLGVSCMPHWMVTKMHCYPSTQEFEVATQEECDEFWGENMSGDDQEMSIDNALDRLSIGPTAQPIQDEIMAVDNVFGPVPSSFDPIESFEDEGQDTNHMPDVIVEEEEEYPDADSFMEALTFPQTTPWKCADAHSDRHSSELDPQDAQWQTQKPTPTHRYTVTTPHPHSGRQGH